jgi:casein kinase 1
MVIEVVCLQLRNTLSVDTSRVNKVQTKDDNRVVQMLGALANMHLEETDNGFGDRNQVANAVREARNNVHEPPRQSDNSKESDVIVISSDVEKDAVQKLPKAQQLSLLTGKMSGATDNQSLSKLVLEFVDVLEVTCSRSLTIEGFAFLDGLYKRLADPSVFIQPMRTSKKGGKENADKENPAGREDAVARRRAKMGKLLLLKGEVTKARDNKTIAKLVKEFGAEIDKGKGKTLTKNAMEFLHTLGARLQEVR